MNSSTGAALPLILRNWPPCRIRQPEPQQMTLARRLGPVLVFAARVQHHEIIEELDIAASEFDVDGAVFGGHAVELDGFLLRRREFRHSGQTLRLVDGRSGSRRAEIAFGEREDRLLEPRIVTWIHLAAA